LKKFLKKTSGIKFINKAIKKGAAAIVIEKKNIYIKSTIPVLKVSNVRKKLAEICSNFYKKKPMNIIAVTGTNGKTSVADFFYQILSLNKVNGASIGTLGLRSKLYNKKTTLTSIDALSLKHNLEILKKKKVNNDVIEASSHGLDQKRLDHLNINTGIFTNLSHDHLDYHKDIKSYLNAKMYLFRNLVNPKANIITDEENKEFKIIKKIIKKRNLKKNTIGKSHDSIVILSNIYKKNKQLVKIKIRSKIFTIKVPLIGFFQIKNLLMAVLAARASGLSFEKIFKKNLRN
jgi:murE/murF fusion protein